MSKSKVEIINTNGLTTYLSLFILLQFIISISCSNNQEQNKSEAVAVDAMDARKNNSTVTDYTNFVNNGKNKLTLDHA